MYACTGFVNCEMWLRKDKWKENILNTHLSVYFITLDLFMTVYSNSIFVTLDHKN